MNGKQLSPGMKSPVNPVGMRNAKPTDFGFMRDRLAQSRKPGVKMKPSPTRKRTKADQAGGAGGM